MMDKYNMKDIEEYEGLYSITPDGKVWSHYSNKFIKPTILKSGHYNVDLYKNGIRKHKYIHRLVAQAYIPNPNNYEYINHKDENPSHNYVDNLEWCTKQYNDNYGTVRKRQGESKGFQVKCIETNVVYVSYHEAARQTGISATNICRCCNNKRKTAGGYHWKKEEGSDDLLRC